MIMRIFLVFQIILCGLMLFYCGYCYCTCECVSPIATALWVFTVMIYVIRDFRDL